MKLLYWDIDKNTLKMESFRLLILCSTVVYTAARGITYDLPWATDPATKAPCATDVCQEFQNLLCLNGGKCELTPECGARCTCRKGFTGFFCGVKVKTTLTTGTVLLDALQRAASDKVKNSVDTGPKVQESSTPVATSTAPTDRVSDKAILQTKPALSRLGNSKFIDTSNTLTTTENTALGAEKSIVPNMAEKGQPEKMKPVTAGTVTLGTILQKVKTTLSADSVSLVTENSSGRTQNVELKNSG